MKKIVEIDVDENGNVSLEGKGFEGIQCESFISKIINLLGFVTNIKKKIQSQRSKSVKNVNKTRE